MFAERIAKLRLSENRTGVDFVAVSADQLTLTVYFHRDPNTMTDTFVEVPLTPDDFTIVSTSGGEGVPVVEVVAVDNDPLIAGTIVLTCDQPGDFSRYRLTIDDERVDIFFRSVTFSFKAGCPDRELDCKAVAEPCPPEPEVDFPVDYMARDFLSLRGALLDFASQRFPDWREKIEADAGVMLMEVMAALGDELAYTQDRVAREAYLETATQRRSVRKLTRLVDYHLHDGRSGTTWLDVEILSGGATALDRGWRVWSAGDDGVSVPFEVGTGLFDTTVAYSVLPEWNSVPANVFDPEQEIPAGTTELWLDISEIPAMNPPDWNHKWVLIRSDPTDSSRPARRHLVYITEEPVEYLDEISEPAVRLMKIVWGPEHALPWCLVPAEVTVRGNLVPATAGQTFSESFRIAAPNGPLFTVEREGPRDSSTGERSVTFLRSLLATETAGLGFLGADLRDTRPELKVRQEVAAIDWQWRRSLLESTDLDAHYTLEDGTWRRVIGFQRATVEQDFEHVDYASGDGYTIRFGNDGFGRTPADGDLFVATYRTGPGAASNVPAGAIKYLKHPVTGDTSLSEMQQADLIPRLRIENPLAVTDGIDPEDLAQARQLAPEEFRAVTHRAVIPKDYCEQAERLGWVQKAGARFRWTGSWLSGFVTPDPEDAYSVTDAQHDELVGHLNCVRQAGREIHVLDPSFRAIDLAIKVCVKPGHLPSEVRDRVLRRLRGDGLREGYFGVDTFTFGMPLQRLTLEAIIGAVPGVLAVKDITIGARGIHHPRPMERVYLVPDNQIIRLANDPRTPERGSVKVYTEGGV